MNETGMPLGVSRFLRAQEKHADAFTAPGI